LLEAELEERANAVGENTADEADAVLVGKAADAHADVGQVEFVLNERGGAGEVGAAVLDHLGAKFFVNGFAVVGGEADHEFDESLDHVLAHLFLGDVRNEFAVDAEKRGLVGADVEVGAASLEQRV
jgi:hypothetical protein